MSQSIKGKDNFEKFIKDKNKNFENIIKKTSDVIKRLKNK